MPRKKKDSALVIVIDDNRREAANAVSFLEATTAQAGIAFRVYTVSRNKTISDWLGLLEETQAIAALIDHRFELAGVPYTGLELANSIRDAKPSLPLFILTKYAQDDRLEEKGYALDDIIDKTLLRRAAEAYTGRLLRAMNRYEVGRTENSSRMQELIQISFDRSLSESEQDELIRIRSELGISVLGNQIEASRKLAQDIANERDLIGLLKTYLAKDE